MYCLLFNEIIKMWLILKYGNFVVDLVYSFFYKYLDIILELDGYSDFMLEYLVDRLNKKFCYVKIKVILIFINVFNVFKCINIYIIF